jgi:hypothetical protein
MVIRNILYAMEVETLIITPFVLRVVVNLEHALLKVSHIVLLIPPNQS